MNYEKAYKEALEKARQFSEHPLQEDSSSIVEYIFPELKESEDERIRKAVIEMIHDTPNIECEENYNVRKEDIIAWLEKQGGTSKEWTISDAATFKELIDFLENGTAKLQHDITRYANWLKIQLAPKVKPKFNVGEWITNSIETVQITGYDIDYGYQVDYKGNLQHRDTDIIEKEYHLWTIADAKDGDVLACGDKVTDYPFIFHNLTEKLNPRSYCGVNTLHYFQENDENGGSWCDSDEVRPATKEQRELLFQKMKEAGYEWDAYKKELKKVDKTKDLSNYIKFLKTFHCWSKEQREIMDKYLEEQIKKNYSPIDSRFDYENANIQQKDFAPKASTANRQLYNRAILKILSNYVEKYPDIRFGQMLCNLRIGPAFNEESQETYWKLNETINKQK